MDKTILEDLEARRQASRQPARRKGRRPPDPGQKKKLSARDRLEILLDPGSFKEIGLLARSQHPDLKDRTPADGLIAGSGTIDGRVVYVASEDVDVVAGTRGLVGESKVRRVRDLALRHRKPFIALMEAGAGRFQEVNGATAAGLGKRFVEHFRLSGKVPQIAAFMGACFGGPSFTGAQSDFITIVEGTGFMGMSGPPLVKVGIGLDVTMEEIGGAQMSAAVTGQADHLAESEQDALLAIRRFLSFLPSSCYEQPPVATPKQAAVDTEEGRARIDAMVPENHRRAYNMRRVIEMLVDGGDLFDYRPLYGASLITALGRIEGHPVGIVANNPMNLAGAINPDAALKYRKFVDLCNAFHIPLVFLCDCPGFLVGPAQEHQRALTATARLLNSVINLSVPRITIVARKAIGLAYIAMCGKAMGPDAIVGWPTSFFDAMGPAAGVELVHARALAASDDPDKLRADLLKNVMAQGDGYLAAERGIIDDIVKPSETRAVILGVIRNAAGSRSAGFKHRIDP